MKKYRITKHGQKLWHEKEGNVLPEEQIRVRFGKCFSIEGAIELGLFEEVPERIKIVCSPPTHLFISKSDGEFSKEQQKTMEHAINGEYAQIKEVWELFIDEWKEYAESRAIDFLAFLENKLKELEK